MNTAFPDKQGHYVWTDDVWTPAITVPCDHIVNWEPNTSFLMRDMCYVDEHGVPSVSHAGLYFDGVSYFGHNYGRYFLAGVDHDGGCDLARSLKPGPHRRAVQAAVDRRFRGNVQFLGMSWARAQRWYLAVCANAVLRSKRVMPSYVDDLEAYYRYHNLPELAIMQGLRIAEEHRRA